MKIFKRVGVLGRAMVQCEEKRVSELAIQDVAQRYIIVGPRYCGKSTLARQLASDNPNLIIYDNFFRHTTNEINVHSSWIIITQILDHIPALILQVAHVVFKSMPNSTYAFSTSHPNGNRSELFAEMVQ